MKWIDENPRHNNSAVRENTTNDIGENSFDKFRHDGGKFAKAKRKLSINSLTLSQDGSISTFLTVCLYSSDAKVLIIAVDQQNAKPKRQSG
uniref:Transposase n=1 Tax=Ascaris lumbricoides TaxID=6252 RepID=A0A0M3HR30_ASCLU